MLAKAFLSYSASVPPQPAISRSGTAKYVRIPETKILYQSQEKMEIQKKTKEHSLFESQNNCNV